MESTRRTIRPSIDPFGNRQAGASGIPAPYTIKKPTPAARLRQSFAGPQQFLAAPRNSLYPSQSLNVPPSASKPGPSSFGRTPMRSSARGGSQWSNGRQSMVPATPLASHSQKDPRNIRDKAYQQTLRNTIFAWLQESQFQSTISRQTLLSPTAKDFRAIFEHLVGLLDPTLTFGERGRKFEDEVIPILKALHYPFADSIDKKWLAAPASMHSWPSLLAMLHWLTELSKARYAYLDSADPTLQDVEQVPDNFDDENHHGALAFNYYGDAYGRFLSGEDNFSEQDQYLDQRYARKNESVFAELEALNTELQALSQEYQNLTEKPAPIVDVEIQNVNMKKDKKKYEEYLAHCENRKRRVLDAISKEESDIAKETATLQKLREEQERLAIVVREQNLTPEEVAHMNSEQETLSRSLEELRRKNAETSNNMRSLEVALAKRSENVEQAVDEYTDFLDRLGLFPTPPPPLPQTDLRLEINFASSNPAELVRRSMNGKGADLKNDIKPVLDAIAQHLRQEHQRSENEVITVEQELDEVGVETDRIEEDIFETDRKTTTIQDEVEAIRVATQQEAMVTNGEAVRLQKELAHARTVALANGVGVKSRLQALQIAYQEQMERVDRLKEETVRMILKSSSDMAAFQEEVSGHLNNLRQFTEEN
ncbi:uncharacterized protein FOMMEDRAFT_145334 [Fomitiporia mediterranea MF3/22]|uniref:uncharacterized protein n=1 Tax=Fomitiporia mediterranea (strain MF3/22) TaxID=694068 RepID=UPI0004408DF1|nr:uncharacterized protein FOMMEDRAFT_145334 [Fomitiporia mediterranea MF3/22]EJD06000.1 hypothetical protein FOMMEDRAFT_145334 [Fomitiporia mediterranea MF3/22]